MLPCERPINNQKLIYILHDHVPAPTIDFQAVICVINRLLDGHCFLEHRCHDIIRKTNSTFLSVDRSPRQLPKAKKSGSSLFIFFFFKSVLTCFWEGSVDSQNHINNFPFEKRGGSSTGSSMQHATRNTQHATVRLPGQNGLAYVPRNLRGVPKSSRKRL